MIVDNSGNVYVAGNFTDSTHFMMAVGNFYVAKWDGTTWSMLGTGANSLNANGPISSICMDKNGNIYVAGNFRNASWNYYVAKWDGTSWSDLGNLNANLFINSICVDDSLNVYCGGNFTDAAGHAYVAKWDNATSSWTELGTGFDSGSLEVVVTSICVDSLQQVYVAIDCDHGVTYSNVYKWDSSSWNELGHLNSTNGAGSICLGDSGYIYATTGPNASGYDYVAKYSPQTNMWGELGNLKPHGPSSYYNPGIATLCIDKYNNVYAAGGFTDSISPTDNYCYVAEYGPPSLGTISTRDKGNNIKVYPNPISGEINIIYSLAIGTGIATYYLYDVTGKICKEGKIDESAGVNIKKIDTADLPGGFYFLNFNGTTFKITKI